MNKKEPIDASIVEYEVQGYWWSDFNRWQRIVLFLPYLIGFIHLYITESNVRISVEKKKK